MKIETTLEQMRKDETSGYGDWHHVFAYAAQPTHQPTGKGAPGFHVTGVAEVLASVEGENDGPTWAAILRLHDGRFAYLEAGCDYTGWG